MSLKEDVAVLQAIISAAPFVTGTSLFYEERPPSAGLIKGTIRFTDGSQLDFREFLIFQPIRCVIKYAYHYRKDNHLIFRYDNANDPAAKGLPTFPSHKHTPANIHAAEKPSMEQVLQEILSQLKP